MLSFTSVNWGSSSAWIGAYFLGRIEKKTVIRHKLVHFLKSWGLFQCIEEYHHKRSFEFLLLRGEDSGHHLRTHFFHVEIVL